MGTGIRFNDEGTAAMAAVLLRFAGYGVLWRPDDGPRVVMTSASQEEVKALLGKF